jgi:hypothetical protein
VPRVGLGPAHAPDREALAAPAARVAAARARRAGRTRHAARSELRTRRQRDGQRLRIETDGVRASLLARRGSRSNP